ncbi:hypothetical protein CN458_24795 [Bacillus cereus]|nr:hypothetical protein CN458_24795 [Bacillus cereus]
MFLITICLDLLTFGIKTNVPLFILKIQIKVLEEVSMENLDTFLTKNYNNFPFIKSDKLE